MKAVVMEIRGDTCIVLQRNGVFVQIPDQNYQVGQQICLGQKFMPWLAAAACLVLLCTALLGWYSPVSYLYLDINPSLRLEVNCLGQVIATAALNEDARQLLDTTGKPTGNVSDCMEQLLSSCRAQGYIQEGGANLELHLRTDQPALAQQVEEIAQTLEGEDLTISLYRLSREENKKVIQSGVSPKRLEAVKQYTDHFGGTLEENMAALKGTATNAIFRQIREAGGQLPAPKAPGYVSPQRKHAVHSYTQQFGGTLEENMEKLRGLTLAEIHQLIREDRNP